MFWNPGVAARILEDPYFSDIPEWLQDFKENLVDDEIPVHGESHASSSHEPPLELTPTRSADLGKHSVYTHFPKDRNCAICQRTKITRAPCRRRIGGAVFRAAIFGDYSTNQTPWRGSSKTWEHAPWYGSDQFEEKVTLIFSENQKGLFQHLTNCFLVHFRKLHMPPSRWTQSQTFLAER